MHFLSCWKNLQILNVLFIKLGIIRNIFWTNFGWGFFFWFDNVIFAWIKVVNVQSPFTPSPLEVLTRFQDWELGQSISLKIAQKFCAIFCAIFWKLPNSGEPATALILLTQCTGQRQQTWDIAANAVHSVVGLATHEEVMLIEEAEPKKTRETL